MKAGTVDDLLAELRPRQRVFVQGATGEPAAFTAALQAGPDLARGVDLWSCLVPGLNSFDYGALPNGPNLTTFMASPALEASIASGRTIIDAMPYSAIGQKLSETQFDLVVLQAAPPDDDGLCSFSVSCDTPALVWPNAKRRAVFINPNLPRLPRADAIPVNAIDIAIPTDCALPGPSRGAVRGPALAAIARIAADLIPDGAVIQSGIGEAPAAVIGALTGHRNLRIHSGIITEDYRRLSEASALADIRHNCVGIAWGTTNFYDWLAESDLAQFRSIPETHGHASFVSTPGFVSIGSALEVDLFGAANLEFRAGRRISSIGGAPDYVRGAAASVAGRSILAFPSTARGASRIVPCLDHAQVSLPASWADTILTEHGAAEIRTLTGDKRAEALIAIAAPDHQAPLEAAWRRLRTS
jgi:acyl-CoA hydrolase